MAYQVQVHDDGDTEIRDLGVIPTNTFEDKSHLSFNKLRDLIKELEDYGHDKTRIDEAIRDMIESAKSDWVKI